jgi:tRNA G37 N-methylase Trm5
MIQKMFTLPKQYLKTVSDKLNKEKVISQESNRRTADNTYYFNKLKDSYKQEGKFEVIYSKREGL